MLEGNNAGTRGYMPFIAKCSGRMHDVFALAVSLLNVTFEAHAHAATATYDRLEGYPPVGDNKDALDNTVCYPKMMPNSIREALAQMLVFVYRPDETGDEKTGVALGVLHEWEWLSLALPAARTSPGGVASSGGTSREFRANVHMMRDPTQEGGTSIDT